MADTSNRYPKPLWERAVNAYLQEFCKKHDFELYSVGPFADNTSGLYHFMDGLLILDLDDIRLDVDGIDTKTKGRIDSDPDDIMKWYSDPTGISYRTYLLLKHLGKGWEAER